MSSRGLLQADDGYWLFFRQLASNKQICAQKKSISTLFDVEILETATTISSKLISI